MLDEIVMDDDVDETVTNGDRWRMTTGSDDDGWQRR
jgi:hypothetical protein